jgi:hypothetical protein
MKTRFVTQRIYTRPGKMNITSRDFVCGHCGAFVSTDVGLSGVCNRNHCPYCLSSRHLDLFEAGDRLSACKARMRPVGLTLKRITNKCVDRQQGELMLVHVCDDCGKVSINRIAADDVAEMILSVLEQSAELDSDTLDLLAQDGIVPLSTTQVDVVHQCLFGTACQRHDD